MAPSTMAVKGRVQKLDVVWLVCACDASFLEGLVASGRAGIVQVVTNGKKSVRNNRIEYRAML